MGLIVYFSSRSENTHRFVEKPGLRELATARTSITRFTLASRNAVRNSAIVVDS